MSHRAEEEQLYRQSREVQFIRAATARSPTAAPPSCLPPLRSRNSIAGICTSPSTGSSVAGIGSSGGASGGEDLLLSVLQYPVTAAGSGSTGFQNRVASRQSVGARSPGAPPPYYPSAPSTR